MLVSGPAIVAFVNSAGGGHRDRLIERFAVAAMSDAQLLMMNPSKLSCNPNLNGSLHTPSKQTVCRMEGFSFVGARS
jgi:hypothetical protein